MSVFGLKYLVTVQCFTLNVTLLEIVQVITKKNRQDPIIDDSTARSAFLCPVLFICGKFF